MAPAEWSAGEVRAFVDLCLSCGKDYELMLSKNRKLRAQKTVFQLQQLYMDLCAQLGLALYSAASDESRAAAGTVEHWQSKASHVLMEQAAVFSCFLRCFWKVRARFQLMLPPNASVVQPIAEPALLAAFNVEVCKEIRDAEASLFNTVMSLISSEAARRGGSPPGGTSLRPPTAPARVLHTQPQPRSPARAAASKPTATSPAKDIRMSVNDLDTGAEAKLALKLVPRTQELAASLTSAGFNPNLQLNLSRKKPASVVARHINKKWRAVVPSGFELRVYPMPGNENHANDSWGVEHNRLSMGRVFTILCSGTELQLQYDLATRTVMQGRRSRTNASDSNRRAAAFGAAAVTPRAEIVLSAADPYAGAALEQSSPPVAETVATAEPPAAEEPAREQRSSTGQSTRLAALGMPFSFDEASKDGFSNFWSTAEAASEFEQYNQQFDDTSMPASMFAEQLSEQSNTGAAHQPSFKKRRVVRT